MLLHWPMDYPVWNAQAPQNGWKSDLCTAEFAALSGMAVDMLGSALPEPLRGEWKQRIRDRGVQPLLEEWLDPDRRIHALDTMGHNWWTVCVGGAALGLFAVRDVEPEADVWFSRIADGIVEFFHYPGNVMQNKQRTFGAQGDFIESVGYLDYTLQHLALLFDLYREHLGRDVPAELPVLGKICDYYMALIQPLRGRFQRLNFGDMGSGRDTMGSYEHQPTAVWLWLAGEYRRNDLFHLVRRVQPEPDDLLELLFWPEDLAGGGFESAPGDVVFENIGVAVLRDGYHDEATVLAVKTGEKWNHNQSDAGSIILSSRGVEFLVDPGTTEYSNPLHARYFKTSLAHNVTLRNGEGQIEDLDDIGVKFMGRIGPRIFEPGYKYVLADATGPWEGVYRRYHRHLLWLDDVVVLVDDLMAWGEGACSSLFHFAGEAELRSDGFRIQHKGLVLDTQVMAPEPVAVGFATGYETRMLANPYKHEYAVTEKPFIRVDFPAGGAREKLMFVLRMPGSRVERVEPIIAPDLTGARIAGSDGSWEILCNHRADGRIMHLNTPMAWGAFTTDAFLLAVHRTASGQVDRVGLHNGSFVREAGRTLHSALTKGDVLWKCA